jgi:hypothetical protein
MLRITLMALGLLVVAAPSFAEWQIRPFLGVTFGGGTTLADPENAAGKPKLTFGVSGGLIGEILGIEADVARTSGFLETGNQSLNLDSSVTTVTGNVTIALPRSIAEYSLRPYFVGGAGMMRVSTRDFFGSFDVSDNLTTIDLGGGVTGFLSRNVGVSWDVRHFHTINGKVIPGVTLGPEQVSFWRANMALAFRY